MELKAYLAIIVRRWYMILLATLAIAAGAVYASRLIQPTYQAEASLRVITPNGGGLGDINYQTTYAIRLMNTYAELAASDQVMNEVKQKLNLIDNPDVTVKIVPDSEIILVTVNNPKPTLAAKIANAIADVLMVKSQVIQNSESGNADQLAILTGRQATLQKELDQAKQDYQNLAQSYSDTDAKLAVLDQTIIGKETLYNNLQQQFHQTVLDEAAAVYAVYKTQYQIKKDLLNTQLSDLDAQLTDLRLQYQDLSQKATAYNQQLNAAILVVSAKQTAYQNAVVQYDEARIANMKQMSAQNLVIASPASVPTKPTGLSGTMIAGLGVIGGFIIGIILAFLVDSLDTRLHNAEQVQQLIDTPILGRLPGLGRKDRKSPLESNDAVVQKAYWTMCTKFLVMLKERTLKTVLITSPNPAEGKSTVISGIAAGLARAEKKVLVVDADMRKPKMHALFNVPNERGLSNYIVGDAGNLDNLIVKNVKLGIDFLPSGPELDNPTDLLQASRFTKLLNEISNYDVVLIDSPALLAVPDAYSLATMVDGALLVVQLGRTTVDDIRNVEAHFKDINSIPLGSIVNRVPLKRISGNYYQRKSGRAVHLPAQTSDALKPSPKA